MRKLLLGIICLLSVSFGLTGKQSEVNLRTYDFTLNTLIYKAFGKRLYNLFKHNPTIYYYDSYTKNQGHSVLIVKIDGQYQLYRVNVTNNEHSTAPQRIIFDRSDSAVFFKANKGIIDWGLDSLSKEITNMTVVKSENKTPMDDSFSILNNWDYGAITFNESDKFSGPDSLAFNIKYRKLCLIMRWFTQDYLRRNLPDSVMIYLPDEKFYDRRY